MVMITLYAKQKKRHRCTEQTFKLWEKASVGYFERTASKYVYYLGWNRSPAQVGCMRQVLGAGALGRPRGMGWRGRREGGSGWGTHVNPWLIHVNVWQKPLQHCKVVSLQLIKINGEKLNFPDYNWLRFTGPKMLSFHFFPLLFGDPGQPSFLGRQLWVLLSEYFWVQLSRDEDTWSNNSKKKWPGNGIWGSLAKWRVNVYLWRW